MRRRRRRKRRRIGRRSDGSLRLIGLSSSGGRFVDYKRTLG